MRTETTGDPDLVDLCPVDSVPVGYLSVLRAFDYTGGEVTLVHADDSRLRRMAVFDVIVNNADRKGGHILTGLDGQVYGVDHGISFHVQDKLRTVLWGWAGKPIDDQTLEGMAELETDPGRAARLGVTRAHHRRGAGRPAPPGAGAPRRSRDAQPDRSRQFPGPLSSPRQQQDMNQR